MTFHEKQSSGSRCRKTGVSGLKPPESSLLVRDVLPHFAENLEKLCVLLTSFCGKQVLSPENTGERRENARRRREMRVRKCKDMQGRDVDMAGKQKEMKGKRRGAGTPATRSAAKAGTCKTPREQRLIHAPCDLLMQPLTHREVVNTLSRSKSSPYSPGAKSQGGMGVSSIVEGHHSAEKPPHKASAKRLKLVTASGSPKRSELCTAKAGVPESDNAKQRLLATDRQMPISVRKTIASAMTGVSRQAHEA